MGSSVAGSVFATNDVVEDTFDVFDATGAAVTGLVDGSFTKILTRAGTVSAQTVTITEVSAASAAGVYRFTFTANATGVWSLSVRHTTYGAWEGSWNVETTKLQELNILQNAAIATTPTAGSIARRLRFMEEYAGLGRQYDFTYDGSNRVSTITLTLSADAFVTNDRQVTGTFTYGDAANPLRATRLRLV